MEEIRKIEKIEGLKVKLSQFKIFPIATWGAGMG